MSCYIAIGDTHGRRDLLDLLLEKIRRGPFSEHRLIFLGDMIDRGPDSFGVVECVKTLTETKNAIALLGNHEDMLLAFLQRMWFDREDIWMYNGARKTIRSYEKATKCYGSAKFWQAISKAGHYQWLKKLPLYYEDDHVWFSHAPIPHRRFRRFDDYRVDKQALIWSFHGNHGEGEDMFAQGLGKLQVCGHVHALQEGLTKPRIFKHIVYADTGCGCHPEAPLTAVIVEYGKYVGCIQAYPYELLNYKPSV